MGAWVTTADSMSLQRTQTRNIGETNSGSRSGVCFLPHQSAGILSELSDPQANPPARHAGVLGTPVIPIQSEFLPIDCRQSTEIELKW